jgi:hypothetical protein
VSVWGQGRAHRQAALHCGDGAAGARKATAASCGPRMAHSPMSDALRRRLNRLMRTVALGGLLRRPGAVQGPETQGAPLLGRSEHIGLVPNCKRVISCCYGQSEAWIGRSGASDMICARCPEEVNNGI